MFWLCRAEVAERSDYASAADFLAHLRQVTVEDVTDETHIRTVRYASGSDDLVLRYDLWNSEPVDRQIDGQPYTPPNLASPLAVQNDSGHIVVGSATLTTAPQQVWLVAQEVDSSTRMWVAINPEDRPIPLRLETLCGVVSAEAWGMGRMEWCAPVGGSQTLRIHRLHPVVGLSVPAGVTVIDE